MLTVHASRLALHPAAGAGGSRLQRVLVSPQLRAFLAAAERRSFCAGAKALHLSESALKQRIHQLEELIGAKLTVPGRRPLRLTPAGGRLLLFAATLRDQCDKLELWLASQGPNGPVEAANAPHAPASAVDSRAAIALLEQASQLLGEALALAHGERGVVAAVPIETDLADRTA